MSGLEGFFSPKSVAIVGASKDMKKPSHEILANFVRNSEEGLYSGSFTAINPKEDSIECLGRSVPCRKSVKDVPGDVDMAIIAVPAAAVNGVIKECGEKGVKSVVVVSAGFKEVGTDESRALEDEMRRTIKEYGMRVIGPNCLGVIDLYTGVNTIFVPERKALSTGEVVSSTMIPERGRMSLSSQSGSFGVYDLEYMHSERLGMSKFIAYGNMADVNETELLEYLGNDDTTDVILMYVESINDGRRFMQAAKKVSKYKPIMIFKGGRSPDGGAAAKSHTGSMSTGDDVYDAAFRQCGAIRAKKIDEFFCMAKALAYQPPAAGKNIAVLTCAGGVGIATVDELKERGMTIPRICDVGGMKESLDGMIRDKEIPAFSAYTNMIDLTGSVLDDMYPKVLERILSSDAYDGCVFIGLHNPPGLTEKFADKVIEVAKRYSKPIVVSYAGESEYAKIVKDKFEENMIPAYSSIEAAADAMGGLVSYGTYLKKHGCFDDYMRRYSESRQRKLEETREMITKYKH